MPLCFGNCTTASSTALPIGNVLLIKSFDQWHVAYDMEIMAAICIAVGHGSCLCSIVVATDTETLHAASPKTVLPSEALEV